jgi:hypothetical protein
MRQWLILYYLCDTHIKQICIDVLLITGWIYDYYIFYLSKRYYDYISIISMKEGKTAHRII